MPLVHPNGSARPWVPWCGYSALPLQSVLNLSIVESMVTDTLERRSHHASTYQKISPQPSRTRTRIFFFREYAKLAIFSLLGIREQSNKRGGRGIQHGTHSPSLKLQPRKGKKQDLEQLSRVTNKAGHQRHMAMPSGRSKSTYPPP